MGRLRKATRPGAIALIVACCVIVAVVFGEQGLGQASAWAIVVGVPLAGVIAIAAVLAVPRRAALPVLEDVKVPDWVVGRPAEVDAVAGALVRQGGTVGITTGLHGAGGFGKTTLATMVCADRRVRRLFDDRIYTVTIGRDVRDSEAIARKVNEVIKVVSGEDPVFTDPKEAGRQLGSLLDKGPRRLLVLDDVWEPGQLGGASETVSADQAW